MTTLLAEVMRKVAELPENRQDDAARVLLTMLENDISPYGLTEDQLHEVELAMVEADRGQFASDDDIARVLHKSWA